MKIHNLCTLENGVISGPLSPMMFAQDITAQLGLKFDGLSRIWFDDELLQAKDENTSFDSVVIWSEYKNTEMFTLYLNTGINGLPIAYLDIQENKVEFSPAYRAEENIHKPNDKTIEEVFNLILKDMSLIRPIEKD